MFKSTQYSSYIFNFNSCRFKSNLRRPQIEVIVWGPGPPASFTLNLPRPTK